ncbi:MAG: radical SAM protein, partial [Deltaproteobacteria bacterium]|nr:radical SAM protein [Deltaproteobacteria bacterium]
LDDGYISRAGNVEVFGHQRLSTRRTSGCKTIWAYKMAHVLYNGDVLPCCMDWRRKAVFGNVERDGGLLNVWRGQGRHGFLDKLGSGDELPEDFLCVGCEDAIPAEGAETVVINEAKSPPPPKKAAVPVKFVSKSDAAVTYADGTSVAASETIVLAAAPTPAKANGHSNGSSNGSSNSSANGHDNGAAAFDTGSSNPIIATYDAAVDESFRKGGRETEPTDFSKGEVDVVFFAPPPWLTSAPPLGLASITGFLRKMGWRVKVVDGNVRLYHFAGKTHQNLWDWERGPFWEKYDNVAGVFGEELRKMAREVAELRPSVVGVNCVSRKEVAFAIFLDELKKHHPECKVFIGGSGIGHFELRRHVRSIVRDYMDGFLVGEGELMMHKVLTRMRDGRTYDDIPGVATYVLETSEEIFTPQEETPDLGILAPPDYTDFDLSAYSSPSLIVEWSRGCVGRCTFCNINDLWKKVRVKAAEQVVEEIKTLQSRHGTEYFSVVDPMTNNDVDTLEAVCDGLIREKIHIKWSCGMSPNRRLTAEQFRKMAAAGCYRVEYGVESGSDTVLKRMGKEYKAEVAEQMIRDAHNAGIMVVLYLIVGFPGETEEDLQQTIAFLERNAKYISLVRSVNGMVIIHGAPVERKPEVFGIGELDRLEDGWTNRWSAGDNTPELRTERAARVTRKLNDLGIPVEFENVEEVMPNAMLYDKRMDQTKERLAAVEKDLNDLLGLMDKLMRGEPTRQVVGHDQLALVLCPVWGVDSPPLGLAAMAGFVRNQGYEPMVIDFNIELFHKANEKQKPFFEEDSFRHWTDEAGAAKIVAAFTKEIDELVDRLIDSGRSMIGFTIYSANRLFAKEVMRRIKARDPKRVIVVGGRGAHTKNERLLFPRDLVDYFIVGEGETSLIPLMEEVFAGKSGQGLPGVDTYDGFELTGYEPRPRLHDLTLLPPPAYDMLPLDLYRGDEIPVQFSRGCVAHCTFCNDSHKNTGFRSRPGKHMAAEIKQLVEVTGRKRFRFNDLLINGNLEVLEELCDELIAMDLGIKWIALFQPRGDMKDELLFKMAKAGCYTVNMGVEHGSTRILKIMGKGFKVADMERALRQTRAAGINTMLNFIIGYPGETREDVDETIDFIRRNRENICGVTSVNACILLEDSAIERRAIKLGVTYDDYATRDVNWVLGDNTPDERQARLRKFVEFLEAENIPYLVTNLKERAANLDDLSIDDIAAAPANGASNGETHAVPGELTNVDPEQFESVDGFIQTRETGSNIAAYATHGDLGGGHAEDDGFDPAKGEPRWEVIPTDYADVIFIKCPPWGVDVPPLAIAYLSEMCRQDGLKVQAVDLNVKVYNRCHDRGLWDMDRYAEWADPKFFPKTYKDLWEWTGHYLKQIAEHPAPVIGLSTNTANYRFTVETARRLKEMAPEKTIVIGGTGISNSFDVEELTPTDADYLFFGEADMGIAKFVRAVVDKKDPGDIEGLIKVGTEFTYSSVQRAIVEKGLKVANPTMIELNLNEYSSSAVPLLASRGCVRRCTFCNDHQIYQKYRYREAEDVFKDMEWHVKNRGTSHFAFLDLLLNGNMKTLVGFCDLVIESGYKVAWGGQCIVRKEMRADVLQKMAKAGCMSIVYGMESFSDETLKLMRKYYTQELAKRVLTDTKEAGIEPIINIICGFPGETEEDFMQTYNFIKDNPDIVGQVASVSPCLINLGSELFDRYKDFDIRFPEEDGSVKWYTGDKSNTYDIRLRRVMMITELLASRDKHIHTVNIYDNDDKKVMRARDDKARFDRAVASGGSLLGAPLVDGSSRAEAGESPGKSETDVAAAAASVENALPQVAVPQNGAPTVEIHAPGTNGHANGSTNGHANGRTNGHGNGVGQHHIEDVAPVQKADIVLALLPPWGVNFPPLGIASLAASARDAGFSVYARDMNIECFDYCGEYLRSWWEPENLKYWSPGKRLDEVSAFIMPKIDAFIEDAIRRRPLVVGLSTNESNLTFSTRVAKKIKEALPDCKIMLGGPGVAWPADRQKLVGEAFDACIIGEGEDSLNQVLTKMKAGESLDDVSGLEWLAGEIKKIPDKGDLVKSLDDLPLPLFDEFPLHMYQTKQFPLMIGRGCTNRCTFCNDPQITPKYRFKSPERVLDEVMAYKERYDAHDFHFCDLLINAHIRNLRDFAQMVVDKGVRMAYSGQALIKKQMDDETLRIIAKSGCTSMVFGVESFSDRVLTDMRKGYTVQQAKECIERVHNAGIKVIVNLIVGFPTETEVEFQETIDFLRENHGLIDSISALSACIVTAQSDLEKNPDKYGIVLPKPEHWCQWYSKDGANTYDVRQERLYRMLDVLNELKISHGMTNRYLEMIDERQSEGEQPAAH